jgi:N-acetylglucosamine-6-phosphate deacetylase
MTGRLHVRGGRALLPGGWADADVVVEDGRLLGARGRRRPAASAEVLDAGGLLVAPGLVDLQVNGSSRLDLTATPDAVWRVGAGALRHGVTAFLPTLVSPRPGTVSRTLEVLAAGPPDGYVGASPLGVHCEGPVIAGPRRGVHPRARIRPASAEAIDGWSRRAGVRLATLAPELPGAGAVAGALARRGVVVSAGHSDATYEEAMAAFERGIVAGTHLFNAMSGLHHRGPGLAGAILMADGVTTGLIADGVHVHPAAVALAWRCKGGPRGIALVTDASPTGGRAGTSGMGTLRRAGGVARDRRGTIGGGLIGLDEAVRNAVAFTGCDPADALRAASATPAALLGEPSIGAIVEGARADLVLLDRRLRVVATVIGGRVARPGARAARPGARRRNPR